MFGYILPVQKELQDHEFALYHSFYCGICLDIKARFGQKARFATGFDMTFFAILLSDIISQETEFRVCKCIGNPFAKRAVVKQNDLLDKIADMSVILAYHKTRDDLQDKQSIKGSVGGILFKKAYKKARKLSPEIEDMVVLALQKVDVVQRDSSASLDKLAHPFAKLIKDFAQVLCGQKTSDNLERLCYNIGKFVYLIDALDDLNSDLRRGRFNAYLQASKAWSDSERIEIKNKIHFLSLYQTQVAFSLNSTINLIIQAFNNLDFYQSYSVLKNIIHFGLRDMLAKVIQAKSSLNKKQLRKDMRRK